jgi:transaldolase/glucose-6-phosphate isomerase
VTHHARLGPALDAALADTAAEWARADMVRRIWAKDATVWTGGDEDRWLGWMDAVTAEVPLDALAALAREIETAGLTDVLLLGMGGSSLGPEVLGAVLGSRETGGPALHVLDSTVPAQIRRVESRLDLSRTCCVVSSKSGTTLESAVLAEYFLDRIRRRVGAEATGSRFVAITDPGSALEHTARATAFRGVWHGAPTIGGRFSVLSNFGLVPAAVCGFDVATLLERARAMAQRCGLAEPLDGNPGVWLGLTLGVAAQHGRDKVTFVLPAALGALGCWLEQLLAESTGKAGQGLVPIVDERLGPPAVYGRDRLFVHLRLAGEPEVDQEAAIGRLVETGHPVVELTLRDRLDLGAEFFRWEVATATCGAVLGIHPFDQPDVEASKVATRTLTTAYESAGAFPPEAPLARADDLTLYADARNAATLGALAGPDASVDRLLAAHLAQLRPGDYFALLAYLDRDTPQQMALDRLRHRVRDASGVATCVGFGPRFLHSTGQVFKGGPATGVFLQITADDAADLKIPGRAYTFGVVKAAQALGDLEVLVARDRRVLRVHLGPDVMAGLRHLEERVSAVLV